MKSVLILLIAVIVTASVVAGARTPCKTIYSENYFNHLRVMWDEDFCYYMVTVKEGQTYKQAKDFCFGYGGKLAMPKTVETHKILVKLLKKLRTANRYLYKFLPRFWIGLDDIVKEGDTLWNDNTKLVKDEFLKRKVTENNEHFITYDCYLWTPGIWYNRDCTKNGDMKGHHGHGFICQIPKKKNRG